MSTDAVPREKLKELLQKNGDSLLEDRDRCEGLLKDYCAGFRREISAIVGALEERVPLELRSSWQTAMTPEAMRARLVQRLEDNRGLAPEIASYAVDTWSYALGVNLGRRSERVPDVVALRMQTGVAAQSAAADPRPVVRGDGGSGKLSHQNKAILGGVGLFAAAAVAFALLHHSTPPASPIPNPPPEKAQEPNLPTPLPAPAPLAKDGQNKAAEIGRKAIFHLPVGTPVVVRLNSDFDSDQANLGDLLPATVVTPLVSQGTVAVERGASAQLQVMVIDKSGTMTGKSHVQFALVELTAHGKPVHVTASSKSLNGPAQSAPAATKTGIGSAAGAAIGHMTGRLFHRAGAAAGATGASSPNPAPVMVSAEIVMQFRLTKGISVGN